MMSTCRRFMACVLAIVLIGAPSLPAQARTLDWTAFTVDARLDSTGRLFVRERQSILFNGDWNGGERRFDVRRGQRFVFRRLLRVDSLSGAEIELREGSLDDVDGYAMTDRETLRWRSRRPGDPVFSNTTITYVLEYEYADILVTEGETYRLDHEFGFRDRSGTIANFALTLTVDPAWRTPPAFTGTFREAVMEPGIGFVVNIPLLWRAAGLPSAVRRNPPLPFRLGIAATVLIAIVGMTIRFVRVETAVGRFEPLTPRETIDRAWLEQHMVSLPPELVGYAWDEQVGPAEVAATLARLVDEKRLSSRVESTGPRWLRLQVLHLELLVPRTQLQGYERALIDGLFSAHSSTTSTTAIRERYEKTGFDPSALIRTPIQTLFTEKTGLTEPPTKPRRWPLTLALTAAAIATLASVFVTHQSDGVLTLAMWGVAGLPLFLVARIQAAFWRRRVVRPWPHLLYTLCPLVLLTAAFAWVLVTGFEMLVLFALVASAILLLAAWCSVLNGAHATSTPAHLAFRRQLAAAREYCLHELQQPAPALDDAWTPYLLAFGLGRHVDKWFRAFGGESAVRSTDRGLRTSRSSSSSLSSESTGGGFSGFGGGGGFSGAGATVAFSSAVGAIASGVSAPSSSSSGGGRSSSGGSSGGGGGGGW
jgi:hypothetical protein